MRRRSARAAARARLGLPGDAALVGYAGGIHPSRDMHTLFDAMTRLRTQRPDARLVLTGRRVAGVQVPADALWLGYLPDADMPTLYQALDAVAVMNTPGAFGDYSYPIKLYEAMACGRPVAASRTASTAHGICRRRRDFPDRLVAPGDAPSHGALAGCQSIAQRSGIRGDGATGFPVVRCAACGLPRCVIAGRRRFPSRSEAAHAGAALLPLDRHDDSVMSDSAASLSVTWNLSINARA